jgi:diguanylate cyclase (GGDEF)-like protein/PAS domain S-box-containing protein
LHPQTNRLKASLRLLGCFGAVTLAAILVNLFSQGAYHSGGYLFWVANGTLLAYLLVAPRWRWPGYLLAGAVALITANCFLDRGILFSSQVNVFLNLCEVLIGALLLRGRSAELPLFTSGRYLLRFLACSVVAAPVATGILFSLYQGFFLHASPRVAFFNWALSDGLGTAVATPAVVAIFHARYKTAIEWRTQWIYPVILVAATVLAFSQATVPLLFLLYPLLVITLLRLDLGWSTLCLLLVAITSASLTLHGVGPFAALAQLHLADPSLLLQLFVVTGMFILYSVSVVLERQKVTERKLQEIAALHALVTANSRDVIILADLKGHRDYVSAACESMGGWKPEDLIRQGSLDLVHPLDLPRAEAALQALYAGSEGQIIELRVQKTDGNYLWIEASLRLIRDPITKVATGILNILRDISERKASQDQLQQAYNAVEALAITDGLTGLANRRRFDQYLTSEWRRSMREHTPFSLLMIDADLFKAYNDTCGHPRGDNALKQIAEACMDVVSRPGDLVARYGGEEFSVILPNTDAKGASRVATEICESLRNRSLPHAASPHGILTVSIGCATMVPSLGQHASMLLEHADQALYRAKHQGRNQVCCADSAHTDSFDNQRPHDNEVFD